MKTSTIALTVATALLMTGFASANPAQEQPVPAGIEVITVTAKRIEPSVASACVDAARAKTQTTDVRQQETPADVINSKLQFRRTVHDCIAQSAAEARS